jgi:hypothetical protein
VNGRRILYDDHVLSLHASESELANGSRSILQQALLIRRVRPGARDDLCAVQRTDILFVELNESIKRVSRNESLLYEIVFEFRSASSYDSSAVRWFSR